jgi:hypothetical protein
MLFKRVSASFKNFYIHQHLSGKLASICMSRIKREVRSLNTKSLIPWLVSQKMFIIKMSSEEKH